MAVNIIDTSSMPNKWDAADALKEGWDLEKFEEWTEKNVQSISMENDERPNIVCRRGELPRIISEAEDALKKCGPAIYQRGEMLVRPIRTNNKTESFSKRKYNNHTLRAVDEHWLNIQFSNSAVFLKPKKQEEDCFTIDPPTKLAKCYLSLLGSWTVDSLKSICQTPIISSSGEIVVKPGYHKASELLVDIPTNWPGIPNSPTIQDAKTAFQILRGPVREYPFTSKADESVFYSAVLSAVVRHMFSNAPLHGFTSPVAGSGKGILTDCISIIATGHKAPVVSFGSNDEETEKRLGALFIAGQSIIVFDNVERPISSDFLCSYLTQETVLIRILGKSTVVAIPTTAFLLATGNNLILNGDINRRSLIGRIDPKVEQPETRRFSWNPTNFAVENRTSLVNAALTIVMAYIKAGRPDLGLSSFGSFEGWNTTIRSALVFSGAADPCEVMLRSRQRDPELALQLSLLKIWKVRFSSRVVTVAEIISEGNCCAELALIIGEITGKKEVSRCLGRFLTRLEDRIVGGMRIARAGTSRSAVRWQLSAI